MKNTHRTWERLAALARQAPVGEGDPGASPGFATRVAALAFAAPVPSPWALLERFALRGLLAAFALTAAAAAYNFTGPSGDHDDDLVATDTVGELLDLS